MCLLIVPPRSDTRPVGDDVRDERETECPEAEEGRINDAGQAAAVHEIAAELGCEKASQPDGAVTPRDLCSRRVALPRLAGAPEYRPT